MLQKSPGLLVSPPVADALVCIVDDDESVRKSLSRLFASVQMKAEAFSSAKAFLLRAPYSGPSCLVLDVEMPGLDGLELQRKLENPEVQIVFLTGHGDVPKCASAMKAGAIDFLTKPVDADDLLPAVRRALARSVEVRKVVAEHSAARVRLNVLTPREFEVMQRVIAGLLNKQIADELSASEKTIKIHHGRVMAKMGVNSVPELVRVAQAAGVAPVAAAA